MRYRTYSFWGAAAALVVLVCSGCAGTSTSVAPEGAYVEPQWMARARQAQEEQSVQIAACAKDRGWTASVAQDNSIKLGDALTPEQLQLRDEDLDDCAARFPLDSQKQDAKYWRVKYQHSLDTRRCLLEQGHMVSQPPSEDVWVDQAIAGDADLWVPFQEIVDGIVDETLDLSPEDYFTLYGACPQDGPFAGITFE